MHRHWLPGAGPVLPSVLPASFITSAASQRNHWLGVSRTSQAQKKLRKWRALLRDGFLAMALEQTRFGQSHSESLVAMEIHRIALWWLPPARMLRRPRPFQMDGWLRFRWPGCQSPSSTRSWAMACSKDWQCPSCCSAVAIILVGSGSCLGSRIAECFGWINPSINADSIV